MLARVQLSILLLIVPAMAEAAIVVDHSMNRTRFLFSDTMSGGSSYEGNHSSFLAADDFALGAAATIQHVTWWGLYYQDAMPSVESMRVRFYDARSGDGLPGSVLSEQNATPARTPTGITIHNIPEGTIGSAAEYQFEADLPLPVSLEARTPYWLEITQISSPNSTFGWMQARVEQTGAAYQRPTDADWHLVGDDMAFQLSTVPEPCTLALVTLSVVFALRGSRRCRNGLIR